MCIDLYDEDQARAHFQELQSTTKVKPREIQQLLPPEMKTTEIEFEMRSYESPSSFWITRKEDSGKHEYLTEIINQSMDQFEKVQNMEIEVGIVPNLYISIFACYQTSIFQQKLLMNAQGYV